jgi:ABC-type dipeptide/oligopeptide/nickel transport system permease component
MNSIAAISAAVPLVVLGPLLIIVFALKFQIFPTHGQVFLPAIALGISLSGFWFRVLNTQVSRFLPESSIMGARARGLSEWVVFFRYVFLPLFGKISAYFGTQLGSLLSGSVLVEVIFQWPGLGSLIYHAVFERDYPVIETTLLFTALISVLAQQLGYALNRRWTPKT